MFNINPRPEYDIMRIDEGPKLRILQRPCTCYHSTAIKLFALQKLILWEETVEFELFKHGIVFGKGVEVYMFLGITEYLLSGGAGLLVSELTEDVKKSQTYTS